MQGVTLIGMPGSGKSTNGLLLAKAAALPFVDTDIELQIYLGQPLQSYLDAEGFRALRAQEERCILQMPLSRSVIATGGSAVYSTAAMARLRTMSTLVYLHISFEIMVERLGDYSHRGIAAPTEAGLFEVYSEREPMYAGLAQHRLSGDQPPDTLVNQLRELM